MFNKFRENVKSLLKRERLTYAQLATMTNFAESTIKGFMCGVNDSRRVAEKIANCLNCALQYEAGEYLLISKEEHND